MRRLILILTLALCSCGIPFLQSSNKPFNLKLKLEKGDHYQTTMNADQTITQSIAGNDMTVATKMGMVMDLNVFDIDPSGNYQIRETFKNIHFEMGGPTPVKFDSEDTTQSDPYSSILKNFVGGIFTMSLSPEGKILELNGVKELMDKMMQSEAMGDSSLSPQLLKILQGFWSDNGIRRMTEQGLGYVTPTPMKVGDSWKYETTANMMVPVKINNEYTLKSRTKSSIAIDSKSMMSIDTVMTVGGDQPVTMSVTMNGIGNGTMLIDAKTGLPDSSKVKIDLSGNMGIMGMPSGADMKVPISGVIISTMKYERQ